MQYKSGGIHHLRLNIHKKPIANKYREGKMKRTLKRESKEFEIVEIELIYLEIAYPMSRSPIVCESTQGWALIKWAILISIRQNNGITKVLHQTGSVMLEFKSQQTLLSRCFGIHSNVRSDRKTKKRGLSVTLSIHGHCRYIGPRN